MFSIDYWSHRLREPSTMAGLGVLAQLAGVPAGLSETVVQTLTGVAAIAAVLLPEHKHAVPPAPQVGVRP